MKTAIVTAVLSLASVLPIAAGRRLCAADPADLEFFEKRVRPLLATHCLECHAADTESNGGLLLDSRAGWERGGDSGPAIVPGKPDESLRLTYRHAGRDYRLTDVYGSVVRDILA